jgi:hypothetical protein
MANLRNWSYWAIQIRILTQFWKFGDWWNWWTDNYPAILFYVWTTYSWAMDCVDSLIAWLTETVWPKVAAAERDIAAIKKQIAGITPFDLSEIYERLEIIETWISQTIHDRLSVIEATLSDLSAYARVTLKALIDALTKKVDLFVSWVNTTLLRAVNENIAAINELWDALDARWNDTVSYVQGVEEFLLQSIEEAVQGTRTWTGNQIHTLTKTIQEKTDALDTRIGNVSLNVGLALRWIYSSFEDFGLLNEKTTRATTEKYGMTAMKVIVKTFLDFDITEEEKTATAVSVSEELTRQLRDIELGLDGDWADVEHSLIENANACEDERDPIDVPITVPPDEAATIQEDLDALNTWFEG